MRRDCLTYCCNHCISELLVCLCIRDRYLESVTGLVKAHESRTFPGRKATRVSSSSLDEDFRSVLIVSSRHCSGDVLRAYKAKAKAIATPPVLLGIVPQVAPQVAGKDVALIDLS